MANVLVINAGSQETRVALVEDGLISEYYLERKKDRGIVGNIYKGKVARVLPGMQAAFVDIGMEKAAFLYAGDVLDAQFGMFDMLGEDVDDGEDDEGGDDDDRGRRGRGRNGRDRRGRRPRKVRPPIKSIDSLLKEGQDIVVQVAKDPIGTKGARLTTHITLPGRHLVFMPTVEHVGISRRIESAKERARLREIIESVRPKGTGFIVRTAAADIPRDHLRADVEFLINLWNDILRRSEKVPAPTKLHTDLDLILRATRDLFTTEVDKLVIDNPKEFDRLKFFVRTFMPRRAAHIEHYTGSEPIFDAYGIEPELERALQRKVWLKSGGYLIIDQAEALTAVDVNSGRYVGKKSLEETITKINLEAVHEIVYQLRLRNLGGIIILDLIDMEDQSNRERVYRELDEALKKDRTRTNILKISELGLVQMTRKRTRESLGRLMTQECPTCQGRGFIKSHDTLAYEIVRNIHRLNLREEDREIVVAVNPHLAETLATSESESLSEVEEQTGRKVVVMPMSSFPIEQYEIRVRK
ncbi:MAG: Ribonuclease G [Myxococcota bacterium]|nr:Ribonuclease G [Myxococcota bacterium]